jgi:ferredoxin--NADP+ reductase
MPQYAIDALSESRIREVQVVGRRGPVQAAFTNPELKELGELEAADVWAPPDEVALDPLSAEVLATSDDRALERRIAMLQEYAGRPATKGRRVLLRFLLSPLALLGDVGGRVCGVELGRNCLVRSAAGSLVAEPTGEVERLDTGLVFRSVGYRGVPLPGVPFDERWGVIVNQGGRVLDPATHEPLTGEYVAGWIKRGPSGVIGTNKPDAADTVSCMLEDAREGRTFRPSRPSREAVVALLRERGARLVSWPDWLTVDALERHAGEREGRPRVKFTSREALLAALDGSGGSE